MIHRAREPLSEVARAENDPWARLVTACGVVLLLSGLCTGQTTRPRLKDSEILTDQQWRELDRSVDRGLTCLATMQTPDGSFMSDPNGQPGVTSLVALAFLSRGHAIDGGPYDRTLRSAVDFVLSCRKPDGLLCLNKPDAQFTPGHPSHTATYNHAIGALMLTELYGVSGGYREDDLRKTIDDAIQFSIRLQKRPKPRIPDRGGWRYLAYASEVDSDLSVTSWHLMFLRSARNAGFKVPSDVIDGALAYIERSFTDRDVFVYTVDDGEPRPESPAMLGAGVLSLSLAGKHQTPMATRAGARILTPIWPINSTRSVSSTTRFTVRRPAFSSAARTGHNSIHLWSLRCYVISSVTAPGLATLLPICNGASLIPLQWPFCA